MNNGEYPTLTDAQQLLPDVVFLAIESSTKKPVRQKWQKITFVDTQKPGYQRHLAVAETIGVLLGEPSNWIAHLDCDTDPFLEFMVTHAGLLKQTLFTRGRRAGGFWFRNINHELNRVYGLNVRESSPLAGGGKIDPKTGLVKIGELRCGRSQSIICGRHPEAVWYQWLKIHSPLELDPCRLPWPEEIRAQLPWNRQQCRSSAKKTQKKEQDDKALLEAAKEALPIHPILWQHFGFPEPAGNPTNSPFRKDERPSFSIYDEGRRAHDHGTKEDFDSFDFYQKAVGKDASHAFRGFVTLAGLAGQLRGKQKPAPTPSGDWIERVLANLVAYFDPAAGCYWAKDNRDVWNRLDVSDVIRRLKDMGYSTTKGDNESISPVEKIIVELQKRHSVDYAGSLAGYDKGVMEYHGKRLLVTDAPKLIEPVKGDWPIFKLFLENLLDAENCDQIKYFNGWMKVALESERAHCPRPGQALVFIGEKACGKSLLQSLITHLFGGRMARPYLYMSGQTSFNGNWFGAEHLMIEDEQPHRDIKSRRNFGEKIKEITANEGQNAHKKFRDGVTLPVFWRLTISINNETENLMILPPFDDSISDKLMIFKASKHDMPMPTAALEDRLKFQAKLIEELPAYADYLLNEWEIEPDLVSERYGITDYQDPDLLIQLGELSPETRLLQLIDAEIFDRVPPQSDSWEGTSLQLEQALTYYSSSVRRQAYDLLNWPGACGTYLGRLKKMFPNRVSYQRKMLSRIWIIEPPT